VALLVVARRFKSFGYGVGQLLQMNDKGEITSAEVNEVWNLIAQADSKYDWNKKVKPSFIQACCDEAAKAFGLTGIEEIGCRSIKSAPPRGIPGMLQPAEFLEQVDKLLPAQPWKRGVHIDIAAKLGCKSSEAGAAIQQLIAEGKRNVQSDGVVYDPTGKVIAVDPERIPAEEK
jgi:hypothetical protein